MRNLETLDTYYATVSKWLRMSIKMDNSEYTKKIYSTLSVPIKYIGVHWRGSS